MKNLINRFNRRVLNPVMSKKYTNIEALRLVGLYKKILPILIFTTTAIGIFDFINSPSERQVYSAIVYVILFGIQALHYLFIRIKGEYFNIWQYFSVLSQHLVIIIYTFDSYEAMKYNSYSLFFQGYSIGVLFYLFLTGTKYDSTNQRIELNSANEFTQQNLRIFQNDDLQVFLDEACVQQPQNLQSDSKFTNTDNMNDKESPIKYEKVSKNKRLSTKVEVDSFGVSSPLRQKAQKNRRISLLQMNKINNGLHRGQRSQTHISNKNANNCRNFANRDKRNLKHYLKEVMIKATQDKNLSKKVYEIKIEYEFENDVKQYQLKLMPFFFDQNYAIITIDNLSTEERLKSKDDLLKVCYHLNNLCRVRVLNNVEQIIRNFIQFQKEAIQNIENNDSESIKSVFSILQSSTFQMCQRTINEVKNVQNLSFSKKRIPIISKRFSILEQIRTILKRFSYQLHKNNQKFRLHIDNTMYEYLKPNNQDNQFQAEKRIENNQNVNQNSISTNNNQANTSCNHCISNQYQAQNNLNQSNNHLLTMNNTYINSITQNQNNVDESFQGISASKHASYSHLGAHSLISQNDLQKNSPKNGLRSSYFLNNQINSYKQPISLISIQQQQQQQQQHQQCQHQLHNQNAMNSNKIAQNQNICQYQSNNNQYNFDIQSQQAYVNDFQLDIQIPNQLNHKQSYDISNLNPPQLEYQQSAAIQQIILGLRKEEIINEENEKNEEVSVQNSINQSQKFRANSDNYNLNNTESTQNQNIRNKSLHSYEASSNNQRFNSKQIESQVATDGNPNNSCQISESVDFINLDEHYDSMNQNSTQKSYQNGYYINNNLSVNHQFKLINCVDQYTLTDKIKMPSALNLQSNISPPNSLLQKIHQSPLSSYMHEYENDHVLDEFELQLNENPKIQNQNEILDDSSQEAIPFEAKDINQENLENSIIKKLKSKMVQLVVSFPKTSLESKNLQEISDLSESCQYEISTQKLHSLDQKFELEENKLQKYLSKQSNQTLTSPTKKEKPGYLSTQSRNSLQNTQLSNLFIHDINHKEQSLSSIDQLSQSQISNSSLPQSKSMESSSINNSLTSSNESKATNKKISDIKSNKSKKKKKKIHKQKKIKEKKSQKSLSNINKEKDFTIRSHNPQKSATSLSNDLHRDQQDNNLKDDIFIQQDMSRVNNILYNFIENSILHSKQNSEIYMRVIENAPPLEGEFFSSYFIIEITNTCSQDIEEVKNKIESSLEYQFRDQNLVDQIVEDENSFTLGLRSARKNLRYLGPFDQINFQYNERKNEITTSFSIYKNIEILYPEIAPISQTRSMVSHQLNLLQQSHNLNIFPLMNNQNQNLDHPSPNISFQYQQSPTYGPFSAEKSKLNSSLLQIQTPVKKRMEQANKDQNQNIGLSAQYQGLSSLTRKSHPNVVLAQRDLFLIPAYSKSKSPLISFQKVVNTPSLQQNLDLSASFISRFRNNSIYNESSSKYISRDSSQNVPSSATNKIPTQKEILNGSVRPSRVKSCYSQAIDDNITKSLSIQSPSLQPKGFQMNPIFSKISQFSVRYNHEDQTQPQQSQNFDQEILFKEKTNSLQMNNEEIKNKFELTNSTSYRFSYLSGNRMITNNTINQNNNAPYPTLQSNSTSINQNKLNQTMNFNQVIQNNLIESNLVKQDQKTSIIVKNNNQNSPITNKNRSQKAFTFFS